VRSSRIFDARFAAEKRREKYADVGAARRPKNDLELARVLCRFGDRLVEIELEDVTLPLERAKLAECDFHLADVEHEVGAIRLVAPRVGDPERASSTAHRADA